MLGRRRGSTTEPLTVADRTARAPPGRPRQTGTRSARCGRALVRTPPNETPPMMTRGPHMCRSAHCTGPVGTVRELLGVRGGAI